MELGNIFSSDCEGYPANILQAYVYYSVIKRIDAPTSGFYMEAERKLKRLDTELTKTQLEKAKQQIDVEVKQLIDLSVSDSTDNSGKQ